MTQIFVLWTICFKQNQKVAILANKEDTAISIIDRIQLAYRRLPVWLKPGIEDWSKKSFSTDNAHSRCRVFSAPTSKTAIRGLACNLLVLDEAAFIDPSIVEEFWSAVFPVISSSKKSKIFMVSTPNGIHNLFYKIFTEASGGKNHAWHAETILWHEVPGRDDEWMRMVRDGMADPDSFAQEFGCQFIDKSTSSVSVKVLEKIEKDSLDALQWFDESLWPLPGDDEEARRTAAFKIWELPREGRIYSLGSDVAAGVSRANSTVIILDITDPTDITQCCEYACNTIHSKTFTQIIIRIANMYGVPNMLVERNNDGTGVCDAIAEDPIYQDRLVNYNPLKDAQVAHLYNLPGISTHKNTKNAMVGNARYFLNEMMAVTIRSIDIKTEMETFGKKKNGTWGKIKEGVFDDRLIALYYALFALNPEITKEYLEVWEYDENDMPLVISDPRANSYNFDGSIYGGSGQYGKNPRVSQTFINPNMGESAHQDEKAELKEWLMNMA